VPGAAVVAGALATNAGEDVIVAELPRVNGAVALVIPRGMG
jgi:hypothetical protein